MTAPPLIGVIGGEGEAVKFAAAAETCSVAIRLYVPSQSLEQFAAGLSVAVPDSFVPLPLARELSKHVPLVPNLHALEAAQDRLVERQLFKSLGILCPPFAGVESVTGVETAIAKFGLPACLLSRGKLGPTAGQSRRLSDTAAVSVEFAQVDKPAIVEADAECDTVVHLAGVRTSEGNVEFWPPVEGSLLEIQVDRLPLDVLKRARSVATRVAEALNLVGVFRVKLLQIQGHLLAYEFLVGLSLRIVNVFDDIQIQGLFANQYENHLLASVGLPLRACDLVVGN